MLRLFPGIGVALCYLCMRDALRKVLHFLGFKLFLKFLKKNFAIQKTFVLLHSTNKQNDKMKNYTKVNPMALKAIHAKQNKQDTKQAILFVALFIVPVIIAGLLEILSN